MLMAGLTGLQDLTALKPYFCKFTFCPSREHFRNFHKENYINIMQVLLFQSLLLKNSKFFVNNIYLFSNFYITVLLKLFILSYIVFFFFLLLSPSILSYDSHSSNLLRKPCLFLLPM